MVSKRSDQKSISREIFVGVVVGIILLLFSSIIHSLYKEYRKKTSLPAKIVSFIVTPSLIRPGDNAKLEWNTENADECWLEWIGLEKKKYKVDPNSLMTVTPKSKTTYVISCLGFDKKMKSDSITVFVRNDKLTPGTYVPIKDVQKKLDCDTDYSNAQKRLILINEFNGARIIIKKKILKLNTEHNELYLTTELITTIGSTKHGTNLVAIEFNSPPKLIQKDPSIFAKIKVGDALLFNCRVKSYCEDGIFLDGHITFEDCYIEVL